MPPHPLPLPCPRPRPIALAALAALAALLLLASAGACSERTPNVCCSDDAECAQLGLPPGSANEYGCSQGFVCSNFYCTPQEAPDASLPDAPDALDAPDAPTGPCNPSAPFGAPTRLANVNSQFEDLSIALTYDQLKAYVVRSTGSSMVIATSTRGAPDLDFSSPATDPVLSAVQAGPNTELYLYPTRDDLNLYYRRDQQWFVSTRLNLNSPFDAGREVYVNGAPMFGHRAMISPDALTLYWSSASSPLREAAYGGANHVFVDVRTATTFDLTDFAISADQLTLYYSNFPNPDIFVSTRPSRDVPFGVGVPVANVNTSDGDVPMAVSQDGCLLYIRSNRPGSDGQNDFWVARRPR